MSNRTNSFLKFIEDVITKKIVYHLFDDEVEFLGCVILSYLLALEITCSCFHDFIDKDLIDLVLPDVRRIAPDYEASRARGFVHRSLELHILNFIIGIEYPNPID
ncbi:hypothetical protein Tco_0215715 [Tanacetum coccineum]